MSTIQIALDSLEEKIGIPSQQGKAIEVTDENKKEIISWLIIKGVKDPRNNSNETLGKLYEIPRYLDSAIVNQTNGSYYKNKKSNLNLGLEKKIIPSALPPFSPFQDSSTSQNSEISNQNQDQNQNLEPLVKSIISGILSRELFKNKEETKIQITNSNKLLLTEVENAVRKQLDLNNEIIKNAAREIAKETINNLAPRKIIIQNKKTNQEIELSNQPRHKIFEECLEYLGIGEHIYVVGPAGTGKTHTGKQIAEALNLDFLPMPQALTKYELSGYLDGSGTYRGTIFRQAIEHGGLLVMDEIDINGASAVAFANSVMANGYCAFPDKMVIAHPNLKIMACANTYGFGATQKYIGRNPLDAASLDRFRYINCDYDEQLERNLFGYSEWLTYIHKVRKAVNQLNLDHIISMRAIQRGLNDITLERTPEQVSSSLWRNLSQDTVMKIQNLSGKYLGEEYLRRIA